MLIPEELIYKIFYYRVHDPKVGSWVDIRIVVIACALANALVVDIDKLPFAGATLEWYSEKSLPLPSMLWPAVFIPSSG